MNIKLGRQHMSAYRRWPLMVLFNKYYRGTVTCTLTWPVACVLCLPIQGITGSMGARRKIVRQGYTTWKKIQLHRHHHLSVEVGITHEVWFSQYQVKCPYVLKREWWRYPLKGSNSHLVLPKLILLGHAHCIYCITAEFQFWFL